MVEILRTADPVRLSYLRLILDQEGIESVVLDANTGALYQMAIPTRLMVDEGDLARAKRIIREADPIA